jgi:hypothetical protein
MEKKKSGNYEPSIHNEEYYEAFDKRNFNSETMIFSTHRDTESLNGKWHFVIDQYHVGLRDNYHTPRELNAEGTQLPWDYTTVDGAVT